MYVPVNDDDDDVDDVLTVMSIACLNMTAVRHTYRNFTINSVNGGA